MPNYKIHTFDTVWGEPQCYVIVAASDKTAWKRLFTTVTGTEEDFLHDVRNITEVIQLRPTRSVRPVGRVPAEDQL